MQELDEDLARDSVTNQASFESIDLADNLNESSAYEHVDDADYYSTTGSVIIRESVRDD